MYLSLLMLMWRVDGHYILQVQTVSFFPVCKFLTTTSQIIVLDCVAILFLFLSVYWVMPQKNSTFLSLALVETYEL